MQKTKVFKAKDKDNSITVTLQGLQEWLGCGRHSAEKIAQEAGAKIKIGRRTLYHVGKIEKYLEMLANEQNA